SAGPAAVALTMQGPWVAGALVNNQWSFAGWGPTRVNELLLQPFVNYNFGEGWYLVSAPILTSDWVASSGDKWTVPLGAGGGKLFRLKDLPGGDNLGNLGDLPLNTQLQAFYSSVPRDDAAPWQRRVQVQFLLPKWRRGPYGQGPVRLRALRAAARSGGPGQRRDGPPALLERRRRQEGDRRVR